jgi:hypothetical protein
MATVSVSSRSYVRPHRNPRVRQFLVDTSQTIVIGDLVVLSTDSDEGNRIKKASADPTTDRKIVGFAAEAITTTGTHDSLTDKISVWLATNDAEFLAHCEDAATIDNNDISTEYGMVNDGTNSIWRVDRSETSAKLVRVLELYDADGDTNGRLVFSVIAPERLYGD